MEGAGGSHYVTFQYHYSYAFKKGHCSPTKWGVTVWMSFLPPRKGVVCTSGHKAFLRLGLYGDGGESKNLVFQAKLIISIRRKGVCHIDVHGNSFYMDMAGDRLVYEESEEGHPCDMAERQQAVHFLPFVCHRWSDSSPA